MLRSNYVSFIPSFHQSWDDSVFFRHGSDRVSLRQCQERMSVPADLYTLSQYVSQGIPLQDMSSAFQHKPSMAELERVQSGVDILASSNVESE